MSAINTRTGQELKFQASLHGVKLKNNSRIFSNDNAKINLTTDQQKKLDEIIKKRISQGRIDGGTNKN